MPTRVTLPELVIPKVDFSVIQQRMQRLWVIRDAPHHSVMGQTRSGKSYLMRYGILPVCQRDRVLIIDNSGGDETLMGLGRVVTRFPSKALRSSREFMSDAEKPMGQWFRLTTSMNTAMARDQVGEALEKVMFEGDWVVVVDELRYITDSREPGLNLAPQWENIVFRGGKRGVGLINLTQEPRWVRGSFYTQPSFVWISRVEDEAAQKRIAEIGSSRALAGHLASIPRRDWIYMDNLESERFWAFTRVPAV